MENNKSNLSASQTMLIVVESMIGVGILSLPAQLAHIAKNDGWMAVIIASAYPFYMVLCAVLIFKNSSYQNINIIEISKIHFGKILGVILALIFASQFLVYTISGTASISNMLRVFLILFLQQYKIVIPILLISIYTAFKGIKALGRINEIIFYLSIPLMIVTILALKEGSILNIQPIFGNPISSIFKASIEPIYSFIGIEVIFLIVPPLMKDKRKIKSSFLKAAIIIALLYTWLSFITIYYLGIDVAQNLYWPTISLAETISIPGISNFEFVFIFLWSSMIFTTIANQSYFLYYSLSSIYKNYHLMFYIHYYFYLLV